MKLWLVILLHSVVMHATSGSTTGASSGGGGGGTTGASSGGGGGGGTTGASSGGGGGGTTGAVSGGGGGGTTAPPTVQKTAKMAMSCGNAATFIASSHSQNATLVAMQQNCGCTVNGVSLAKFGCPRRLHATHDHSHRRLSSTGVNAIFTIAGNTQPSVNTANLQSSVVANLNAVGDTSAASIVQAATFTVTAGTPAPGPAPTPTVAGASRSQAALALFSAMMVLLSRQTKSSRFVLCVPAFQFIAKQKCCSSFPAVGEKSCSRKDERGLLLFAVPVFQGLDLREWEKHGHDVQGIFHLPCQSFNVWTCLI